MKKILSLMVIALLSTASFAQTAAELAKQQRELNETHMKLVNAKPSKAAKKQAKQLKSDGWTVPAGTSGIEQQLTRSQLYGEELTVDENGNTVKRYMVQTSIQTAGTYNAAYAAARTAALTELAAMLKTELVSAMQQKMDNEQSSTISAVTVDKFNERSRAIIDMKLTNSIPVLAIYRRLPNRMFEVQVGIAFDRKELAARIKRNMKKELEEEGDKLNDIVDAILAAE